MGRKKIHKNVGINLKMSENTINNYPNAWNFYNGNEQLISHDKKNKLEYDNLIEFGMSSPLSGTCYWVNNDGKKALINNRCAGPPIWNTAGTRAAIPIWTYKFFKGTVQRLFVLDTESRELTGFKKIFKVLDLRTFEGDQICGYDSPMLNPKSFCIDLKNEEALKTRRI